jgi:hypothetical protein
MKRRYYVKYERDFANVYSLRWANSEDDCLRLEATGWERITQRQAHALCRQERERQRYYSIFFCFADDLIFPASMSDDDVRNWYNLPHVYKDGYLLIDERKEN